MTQNRFEWEKEINDFFKLTKAIATKYQNAKKDRNDQYFQRSKLVDLPEDDGASKSKNKDKDYYNEWVNKLKEIVNKMSDTDKLTADLLARSFLKFSDDFVIDYFFVAQHDDKFNRSNLRADVIKNSALLLEVNKLYSELRKNKKLIQNGLNAMEVAYSASWKGNSDSIIGAIIEKQRPDEEKILKLKSSISTISAGGEGNETFTIAAFNKFKEAWNDIVNARAQSQASTKTVSVVREINNVYYIPYGEPDKHSRQKYQSKLNYERLVGLGIALFLEIPDLPISEQERKEFEHLKGLFIPPNFGVNITDSWNRNIRNSYIPVTFENFKLNLEKNKDVAQIKRNFSVYGPYLISLGEFVKQASQYSRYVNPIVKTPVEEASMKESKEEQKDEVQNNTRTSTRIIEEQLGAKSGFVFNQVKKINQLSQSAEEQNEKRKVLTNSAGKSASRESLLQSAEKEKSMSKLAQSAEKVESRKTLNLSADNEEKKAFTQSSDTSAKQSVRPQKPVSRKAVERTSNWHGDTIRKNEEDRLSRTLGRGDGVIGLNQRGRVLTKPDNNTPDSSLVKDKWASLQKQGKAFILNKKDETEVLLKKSSDDNKPSDNNSADVKQTRRYAFYNKKTDKKALNRSGDLKNSSDSNPDSNPSTPLLGRNGKK